ncbi:hypothetical protein BJV78DRAFT_1220283 [Lactifluus subvellereus]|nr:hypothetical protein BJV78DRAFT_1220283 [Lactifluus subvellereus]
MEVKLKTLKVADLKEICTRANVPTTTRSTKADLITKVLASQAAIDAYNAKYQQTGNSAPPPKPAALSNNDDILTYPEDVDWTLEKHPAPVSVPATVPKPTKTNGPTEPASTSIKPQSKVAPPKAPPAAREAVKTLAPAPATPVDEELEKRKARAARFGIALVEPSKPKTKSAPVPVPASAPKAEATAKATDDAAKLKTRAERFGSGKSAQTGATSIPSAGVRKRGAGLVEEVDVEEQERRRKRAERFGIPTVGAKA